MKKIQIIFTLLMCVAAVDSSQAQKMEWGGVDLRSDRARFSFFAGAGIGLVDDFEHSLFVLELEPRYEVKRDDRNTYELTSPLLIMPESRPLPDFSAGVDGLEAGSTFALIPSVVWTPRTFRCCQHSLFFGAGLWFEEGAHAVLAVDASGEDISVRPGDTWSPVLSVGASLRRPLSGRLELVYKLRLNATFYDSRSIDGPGDLRTSSLVRGSALLTFGLRFKG